MADNSLATLRIRAHALRRTRDFFWGRGFTEIDTPLLSPTRIPEHTITPFKTTHVDHTGIERDLCLVPSPEIWMKRLLGMGSGDIFQISRCFRNGEPPTGIHHPEFTMLEWYSVERNYHHVMKLQEEYFEYMRKTLSVECTVSVHGVRVDITPPFRQLSVKEAFLTLAGVDLEAVSDVFSFRDHARRAGIDTHDDDDWESVFHKLFLEKVEPYLPWDKPLFLFDYPAAIPTLAKTGSDGLFVERWELYIGGIEIANCYTEERDPEGLEKFFHGRNCEKRNAKQSFPVDFELKEIIAHHMPACSGNALGFDRLLMVLLEKEKIQEVLPFAWYAEG